MKTPISVLVVSVLGFVGPSLSAQAIHHKCKAEIRGESVACITTPRDGATIKGPAVRVVLAAVGMGAAHYHLFLDTNVPPAGQAIPEGPGITHLASGEKAHQFAEMAPGLHRLIVVLGDNGHVAVARQKSDTAYFTVVSR